MSKKNSNNKSTAQPKVEEAVEQVVEKEAIIIDPEVLKAEAPEVEPTAVVITDEAEFNKLLEEACVQEVVETREEKIEEIVEAEAQHFDEKEEEFLNSSVEEIEQLPVVDDGVCDECDDKDCPCNNQVDPKAVKPEEKVAPLETVSILYLGHVIQMPKGKDVGNYSRTEMSKYLNTGILPH